MKDGAAFHEEQDPKNDEETADKRFDPGVVGPTVDFLAEVAAGGRALELGVGTGRIAIPLAARGIQMHGIDLAQDAIDRLRSKPGGEGIDITTGDFSTAKVEGSFRLAYLIYNTIMNLTTQTAQVACFRNVAAHLEPGGCCVIETAGMELRERWAGWERDPFTSDSREYVSVWTKPAG